MNKVKYGLFEMFENIQGKNLSKDNPWLNPRLAIRTIRKKVTFSITELSPPELPHCRRKNIKGNYGHLHSLGCSNYEDIDGRELVHRACVLDGCIIRPVTDADFYDYTDVTSVEKDFDIKR